MKIQTCGDPSAKAVDYFRTQYPNFKPIKKVTVCFASENFLVTSYRPSTYDIHAIIENFSGDLIEFSSLNCGYVGSGPNATVKILEMIGLDAEYSKRLAYTYDSVMIEFDKDFYVNHDLRFHKVNTDTFFRENYRSHEFIGCNFGEHTIINTLTREVCMFNPETYNFAGLLHCLHVMKPVEFEYQLKKNSYLCLPSDISVMQGHRMPQLAKGTRGANLIIRGSMFDLICFINEKQLYGTLNCIYSYLTKEALFDEHFITDVAIVGKHKLPAVLLWWKALINIFMPNTSPRHQLLEVSDKELVQNVY